MPQRGQAFAVFGDAVVVEGGGDHGFAFGLHRQHVAPRVDDHAVAPGAAAVFMRAALRAAHDVSEVFDGAGAQQHFPMLFAGGVGECGGQQVGIARGRLRQRPKQLGKAQVVADGESHAPAFAVERHGLGAGGNAVGFGVALSAALEGEQVHFVVARGQFARGVEHQGGVEYALGVGAFQRQGAADDPQAEAAGGAGKKVLNRAAAGFFAHAHFVGVGLAHEAEIFGQHGQPRALGRGLFEQALGALQIGGDGGAGNHLKSGDFHGGMQ